MVKKIKYNGLFVDLVVLLSGNYLALLFFNNKKKESLYKWKNFYSRRLNY